MFQPRFPSKAMVCQAHNNLKVEDLW